MSVKRGGFCGGRKRSLADCGAAWRRQGDAEHAMAVDAGDEDLVQRAVECLLEDLVCGSARSSAPG